MSANTAKAGLTYPSLADAPNVPSNMQTLASQLDGMVIPKYASASALSTANPSPASGDLCYRTDLNAYLTYDGTAWQQIGPLGAWTTYVPTWTAATTNPSLGNGTITSRWCRVGRLIHWMGQLQAGSTTTGGSGVWFISIPVAAASNGIQMIGTADYVNSGDNEYLGAVEIQSGLTTVAFIVKTSQSSQSTFPVSATVPVTLSANTKLVWNISYEAAS
ncbi:hypothetical protein [Kitasatospora aureofaciens]|uniref:hypothetical protein n=1 Tax=Kitasatospora aureofaciens TaxID=1894 RepID=UPI0033C204A6